MCVHSLETFPTNAQPLFESFQNKLVTSMFLGLKTSAIIFIALINEDYKKKSTDKIVLYINASSLSRIELISRCCDKHFMARNMLIYFQQQIYQNKSLVKS